MQPQSQTLKAELQWNELWSNLRHNSKFHAVIDKDIKAVTTAKSLSTDPHTHTLDNN